MANRVWIRDAMVWTTDCGSNDGFYTFDLLWKARTGAGQGTGTDTEPPAVQVVPAGISIGPRTKDVDVRSDMRAATETANIATTLNIQGAQVERIRLKYGFVVSKLAPSAAPNFETPLAQGWYDGLIVAPWQHQAVVAGGSLLGNPQETYQSTALDWIWWQRQYLQESSVKNISTAGLPFTSETLVYNEIDTRNSRTLSEYGSSLYWNVAPSRATQSVPTTGTTINGGCAAWSVLLRLP